jgi:acyl-CoA thioesterase FadM
MEERQWILLKDAARVEIRVGDINYGGHMGNDKALLVFHDARIRFFELLGFEEGNIGGPGIIMRDAHVSFRKEVFIHDVLTVDVGIDDVTLTSFNMNFTVKRERDGAVVFLGSTGLVAFDYETRKIAKLPKAFLEKITHQ